MELDKKTIKHLIWIVFAGVAFNWALQHLSDLSNAVGWMVSLVTPFLLGGAIAFIINVPMRKIEKHLFPNASRPRVKKLRRPLALVLSIVLVLAILTFATFVIAPGVGTAAGQIVAQIPSSINKLSAQITQLWDRFDLYNYFTSLDISWSAMAEKAAKLLQDWGSSLLGGGVSLVSGVVSGVTTFFIGLVFAIYLLMQKEKLSRQFRKLLYALLPERAVDRVVSVARLAHRTFSSFLSGQCIEAVILGSLFVLAMTLLHLPYAPLIGVLIALTALIPMVGAFIGCVVGALLILMVSPLQALEFVVLFLILQQVEGNLIYPHVVGSSVGLPSLWVLVAVTLGGSLMGIGGMLLFIPLCSVCYALLREFVQYRLTQRKVPPEKWRDPSPPSSGEKPEVPPETPPKTPPESPGT